MKPSPTHTEPLTVVMRVRPVNGKEYKVGAKTIVHPVDDKLIVLMDPHDDVDDILRANRSREKHYVFDHVFSPEATQEDVYYAVVHEKGIIESVLSGYNCTVFAYGATGTGKTHTMLGSQEEPGIMVHTLNSLFKKMDQTKEEIEYQVSMGYLEIYNECVRDLLCPDIGSLELREDASGSITVSNLLDISASSTDVILGMLRMGNTNRTSEPTVANKTSSRSHAILKVNVEQRSRISSNVTQEVKCGSLYMVDLAGSERASVTQNRGKRMIEGAHINRSLLALANCINALGSNHSNYVNYRDSKLTRILKEALGGNCKTVMIAHVSPASSSYEETRNTMVYADRSKKIKNKTRQNIVDVNHHVTQYLQIIDELQYQVARLKTELDKATMGTMESSEVTGLCEELRTLAQEQKEIRLQVLDIECQLLQNAADYQKRSSVIKEWEVKRDSFGLGPSATFSSPLFIPPASHPLADQCTMDPLTTSTDALPNVLSETTLSEKPDAISLKQAGNVASMSAVLHPLPTPTKKAFGSPDVVTMDTYSEDCMSGEVQGDGEGGGMYRVEDKAKTALRVQDELLFSVSPDSGTEMSVTAAAGGGSSRRGERPEIEPVEVSAAREEVAVLVAAKQRLEAQHKRVEKALRENRTNISEVREKLSEMGGFVPLRKDMMDLLQHTSDLEASQVEHSLSTMLMGIHLSRHGSLLDQLLQHSATLLALVNTHRVKMEQEGKVGVPEELTKLCGELSERQKRLAADVAEVKMLPVLGDKLQLPSISRLSAKLYTKMTGSKSNFFSDDEEPLNTSFTCNDATSDGHLPCIEPQNKHLRTASDESKASKKPNDVTFPPIHFNPSSIVTKSSTQQEVELDHNSFPEPLKKSDLTQILEAAKKIRDEKIAASMGLDRFNRVKRSPRKVSMNRVANFTSPRGSLTFNSRSTRNAASVQQVVGFLPEATANYTTTEVIDLESTSGEAAAAVVAGTGGESLDPQLKSISLISLRGGQKSRSQTHLVTTSPSKTGSKPKTQRLRRSRSHARIGLPYAKSPEKKATVQSKSISLEDVPNKVRASSPAPLKDEQRAALERRNMTASKPIVKKPGFAKQPVPKLNIKQASSVYSVRPYVIPMARRVSQQQGSSSQQHQGTAGSDSSTKTAKKRLSLNPYPRLKRKHQRQELSVSKVRLGGSFAFPSPYLKQGGSKAKLMAKKGNTSAKND